MSSTQFSAEQNPSAASLRAVARTAPHVPSYTAAYASARRRTGFEVWLLTLCRDGHVVAGCTAYVLRRMLRSSLQIVSCPSLSSADAASFWNGLLTHCREQRIVEVLIDSYASADALIPHLPGEVRRVERVEHVIDLDGTDVEGRLSSNHARNVRRARAAGVVVRRRADAEAAAAHGDLIASSRERRRQRGERVPASDGAPDLGTYAEEGAGAFHEAVLDGRVLSSALVTSAERGAFYESAGTSPEGMACGASHLLIVEIARSLEAHAVQTLDLGGSRYDEHGLRRFKAGFGAREVPLEAATFLLAGGLRRRALLALRTLRRRPSALAARALVRVERYVIYGAAPEDVRVPDLPAGLQVRKLEDEELARLARTHPEIRPHHERRVREGFNGAYGAFQHGQLANVTWLITSEQDGLRPVRNAKLRPGEVEITHGQTRAAFRGRGIWPAVLGALSRIAGETGAHTVLGMHRSDNASSQRAVEKAGYARRGTVLRLVFPYLLAGGAVTFRGHRWRHG